MFMVESSNAPDAASTAQSTGSVLGGPMEALGLSVVATAMNIGWI